MVDPRFESLLGPAHHQERPAQLAQVMLDTASRKTWRRTFLGIDYASNYSHYAANSYYNGLTQQLNLGVGTMIGRKLQLSSQIGAGTSNRFVGGNSVFVASEFEFLSAPTQELFDSRSYFLGVSSSATYTLNSRSSVRVTGNVSSIRRKARGLVDMTSYGAAGDWVYRVNRRTSLGVSFAYNHYDFVKVFGDSDIYTFGTHFGRQFGRDYQFKGALTMSQQSTVGVRTVNLDPVLSAILGRLTGAEVFESNNLIYGYNFSLSRTIRHSTITLTANRGINPGNGYFLTSVNQSGGVAFNHAVSRDLSFTGTLNFNKLASLGFASGAFASWTGGGGVTYKLTDSFGVNARYDWRSYDLRQSTFGRTGFRVSAGITYFPKQSVASMW